MRSIPVRSVPHSNINEKSAEYRVQLKTWEDDSYMFSPSDTETSVSGDCARSRPRASESTARGVQISMRTLANLSQPCRYTLF